MENNMRKILTVKELITILLDYNMDALVYTNANGVPTGISLSNVCYGGGGEGVTKKDCEELIFDIQDEENECIESASEQFVDPYNGHTYVDLGLPSGTLWATMNVGANNETDTGLYFAWGETQGYTDASTKAFSWEDYKWSNNGSRSDFTKYNETDGKTQLDLEDDAAAVNWGGKWHMPTEAQCRELFNTDNCTNEWTTVNGVNGRLFTSVINGKTLFIPAAGLCGGCIVYNVGHSGYVWTSSLNSTIVSDAWDIFFGSHVRGVGYSYRCFGRAVRAVVG